MDEKERLYLIGQRIKETRKTKGLTQAELAKNANLQPSNISELEHGKTHIQLMTFIKIIEGLQVSADEIIRADVPLVRKMYKNEFTELVADCSPKELETIIKFVRDLKTTLRSKVE